MLTASLTAVVMGALAKRYQQNLQHFSAHSHRSHEKHTGESNPLPESQLQPPDATNGQDHQKDICGQIERSCHDQESAYIYTATRRGRNPDLLSRAALQYFDNGSTDVKQNNTPDGQIDGPPKQRAASGREDAGVKQQDRYFGETDLRPIDDLCDVNQLQKHQQLKGKKMRLQGGTSHPQVVMKLLFVHVPSMLASIIPGTLDRGQDSISKEHQLCSFSAFMLFKPSSPWSYYPGQNTSVFSPRHHQSAKSAVLHFLEKGLITYNHQPSSACYS